MPGSKKCLHPSARANVAQPPARRLVGQRPAGAFRLLGTKDGRILPDAADGETPKETVGEYDVDSINAAAFNEHHEQTLDEVRRFERQSFQMLFDQAEKAPEADLFDPQLFAWLKGATLAAWIEGNSYGHYEEHQSNLSIFE